MRRPATFGESLSGAAGFVWGLACLVQDLVWLTVTAAILISLAVR